MPRRGRAAAAMLVVCAALLALSGSRGAARVDRASETRAREEAYRANNVGVAWLEQFNYAEAARHFEQALQVDPQLGLARFNLALALFHDGQLEAAARQATLAAERLPGAPQPVFLLGLIARAQGRPRDAVTAFRRALQSDPTDVGARIRLGESLLQGGDATLAVTAFEIALKGEPYNLTAAYNLSISLSRSGRVEASHTALERFQALRESGTATSLGNGYLEQGHLAEAMVSSGLEPDLVNEATPPVRYVEERIGASTGRAAACPAPPRAPPPGPVPGPGGVALFDADGDGHVDIVETAGRGPRRWLNDGHGHFRAAPGAFSRTGAPAPAGVGAVVGDVTGDGRPDLLVLGVHGIVLYRNDGHGRFSDITRPSGLAAVDTVSAVAAALVDLDHDGDLDLVLPASGQADGGASANTAGQTRVLRNSGKGVFTDVTAKSGISGSGIVGIVPTDFDERRDVDLLLVPRASTLLLFRNMRDGSFLDSATEAALPRNGGWTTVAAGDLNKDGRADFLLGRADGPGVVALSDGRGGYRAQPAPKVTAGARAAAIFDYDNDGLLDLLVVTADGAHLLRGAGSRWIDVGAATLPASRALGLPEPAAGRAVAIADVDEDGDADIVLATSGGLRLWRNEGGNRLPSLTVRLTGHVSNRSAVGAKVELRAGSLRDARETSAATPAVAPADLLFGLGAGRRADAVRVFWPSGILQAELLGDPTPRLAITEVDRKPSSCPFLFAWNGQRFAFVTDFLGGGELGYWEAPGVRNVPDSDEYVRIPGDQLEPLAGRYQLRVTNELEEVLFLDTVRLHVIDHRAGVEVHPVEGLLPEPQRGLRVVAVEDLRPPAAAVDDHGRDVLRLIARRDSRAPDDFGPVSIRGYAAPHALMVSPPPAARSDALLLTGWTDYAFSSDNVAAHQNGVALSPPVLEMRHGGGRWQQTGLAVAVPVGRPQTVVVDLRPLGGVQGRDFRLTTTMRIHWDQVRFARVAGDDVAATAVLDATSAVLHERGFSRPVPAGTNPVARYDYEHTAHASPWKQLTGRYTAEGDVRALLRAVDDRFVIAAPGDEVAIAFDATGVPVPKPGWQRTFLLQADGFSKEMDLHSVSPDQVGPLPFHAMRAYPPRPGERPGALDSPSEALAATARPRARAIPLLESVLIDDAPSRETTASETAVLGHADTRSARREKRR